MQLQTFKLGVLDTNTYLVTDEATQQCLVIDPADDAQFISEEIQRQGLQLTQVIATHGHFDHNLAAAELQLNFDAPFLVHQADEFLIKELAKRAGYWLQQEVELNSPKITQYLEEGSEIVCGDTKLKVIHTPGHTMGCCCLVNEAKNTIFTGDVLFADDIEGRTDLDCSSPTKMKDSLHRLHDEHAGYRGLPGHGREFIVGELAEEAFI